jgi:hypothetical protein
MSFKLDPDKRKTFEDEFPGIKSLKEFTTYLQNSLHASAFMTAEL